MAPVHRPETIPNKVKGLPFVAVLKCEGCGKLYEVKFRDAFAAEGDAGHAREAYEKARTVPFQPSEIDLMKLRQLAWIAEHSAELPGEDRCARYREAAGYWEQWKTRGGGAPPSAPVSGCK